MSESKDSFFITIKIGKGKGNKADNMRVQKYLEDDGIEKNEGTAVNMHLRMAKVMAKRVGWKLQYELKDISW
jgi:hypothetical protein